MQKINIRLLIMYFMIAVLTSCSVARPAPVPPDYWPTEAWRKAAPEEQGMDSELLAQMVESIQRENPDLHSLLIVRNGYLVSELYVYPYSASQPHSIASVTKSVISALTGIAIQQGTLQDTQQSIYSLLLKLEPEDLDERKKAITVEDVLTQTSGLKCADSPEPGESTMEASANWVQFVLDQPVQSDPGTKFWYCSSSVHLLSALIQQATGMSAREYANQNLFGPIGIEPVPESRWPSDPQGVSIGGYGLALTPGDMSRLGFLFLNQGKWEGKTIVPAEYVAESTTRHSNLGEKKEYGYLWWIDPQEEWFAALGRGGQHIFVYPAENLVVVFTAGLQADNDRDLTPLLELFERYIRPALVSEQPLPENPGGFARLEQGLDRLSKPESPIIPSLPVKAFEVSNQTYLLEGNPFGWETVRFEFQQGSAEAVIVLNETERIPVGLDNAYRLLESTDNPFPGAFRGRWVDQNTFVIDEIMLGQVVQLTHRIEFAGESISIDVKEKYSGMNEMVEGSVR